MFKVNASAVRWRGEELNNWSALFNLGRKSNSSGGKLLVEHSAGGSHRELVLLHTAQGKAVQTLSWLV